ncbi:terpene cyclase/mutase family protein [candidate division WOR-3 bacterium]|nr:terpene cyclase/mutase family protein [candidate division WOR-3 bacterium]
MLRVEQALNYIEFKGSDLDRYRSRFLFDRQRDDTMATWLLGAYQNSDGGYPLNLEYSKPSNISETAKIIGYAAEFEVVDSPVCARSLDFIVSRQMPEGYWQEKHSQLELAEELGGEFGRAWLSAYVGRELCRAGFKDSHQAKKTCNYLLSFRSEGTRLTTSPSIHYLAMSFFALHDGPQCGLVSQSLDYALANFTTYPEPRLITLQAECLLDVGIPQDHELLRKARSRLVALQAEDGGWGEDYKGLRVRVTLDVLKLLLNLGAWKIVEEV